MLLGTTQGLILLPCVFVFIVILACLLYGKKSTEISAEHRCRCRPFPFSVILLLNISQRCFCRMIRYRGSARKTWQVLSCGKIGKVQLWHVESLYYNCRCFHTGNILSLNSSTFLLQVLFYSNIKNVWGSVMANITNFNFIYRSVADNCSSCLWFTKTSVGPPRRPFQNLKGPAKVATSWRDSGWLKVESASPEKAGKVDLKKNVNKMWLVESEWKSEKKKEMDLNCLNACWALEAKLQVGPLPVTDKLITSWGVK